MSKEMLKIAETIKAAGGRMYLVGGAVRDFLMDKPNKDEDYCVVGISYEEFVNLFPEAYVRGKDFPVFDFSSTSTAGFENWENAVTRERMPLEGMPLYRFILFRDAEYFHDSNTLPDEPA